MRIDQLKHIIGAAANVVEEDEFVDGSQFHRSFGYYAHGVGPETAKAPTGWEERLVTISVEARPGSQRASVAFCLEIHDLVLAKCAAGRERDWDFALEALNAGLVDVEELLRRTDDLPIDGARREHVRTMVEGLTGRRDRR